MGTIGPDLHSVPLAPSHVAALCAIGIARPDEPAGRRLGQVLQIDLHVVAPAARRTTASLRLVEAVTTRARRAGLERVRFFCDPAVRDTVNLGRRMGAIRLPSLVVLARRLGASGHPS